MLFNNLLAPRHNIGSDKVKEVSKIKGLKMRNGK